MKFTLFSLFLTLLPQAVYADVLSPWFVSGRMAIEPASCEKLRQDFAILTTQNLDREKAVAGSTTRCSTPHQTELAYDLFIEAKTVADAEYVQNYVKALQGQSFYGSVLNFKRVMNVTVPLRIDYINRTPTDEILRTQEALLVYPNYMAWAVNATELSRALHAPDIREFVAKVLAQFGPSEASMVQEFVLKWTHVIKVSAKVRFVLEDYRVVETYDWQEVRDCLHETPTGACL